MPTGATLSSLVGQENTWGRGMTDETPVRSEMCPFLSAVGAVMRTASGRDTLIANLLQSVLGADW
jgi:hypothetical protein